MPKIVGDQTGRGSGESLGSLEKQADKHTNWYDAYNDFFGKGVDDIDFTQREFTDDGQVKVTKYDVLMGRSQPELQAEYERQRQAALRNSGANQEFQRLNNGKSAVSDKGINKWSAVRTNIGDIESKNTNEKSRLEAVKPLLEELGRMKGGKLAVVELGPKPTATQVAAAIGKLTPDQPSEIRAGETHQSTLETAQVQRDVAKQQAATQAGTLELNRTIASNNQTLELAKLAHADKVAQQEREIANIKIRNAERTANADRELRRDLAMLTRQDNADERAYRRGRDERESRQLMIMQLMKGLSQMGQSFAI